MSPEQVRGQPADHARTSSRSARCSTRCSRAQRAFHGDSAAETMRDPARGPAGALGTSAAVSAGARAHRPPLPREEARAAVPLGPRPRLRARARLSSVSGTEPDDRQEKRSTQSNCFSPGSAPWPSPAWEPSHSSPERGEPIRPLPTFQQLTFRRGEILSARFAPDQQSVAYSAAWDGKPLEMFLTRIDHPEPEEPFPAGRRSAEHLSPGRNDDLAQPPYGPALRVGRNAGADQHQWRRRSS